MLQHLYYIILEMVYKLFPIYRSTSVKCIFSKQLIKVLYIWMCVLSENRYVFNKRGYRTVTFSLATFQPRYRQS